MIGLRRFNLLLQIAFLFSVSDPTSTITQPQPAKSFNLTYIQQKNVGSCSYNVVISTSCSSTKHTRDEISIAFGDAYGNQIYAPRIDDPSSRAFERCSSDTFQINGPCSYQICYVYLYRSGPDGWKPGSVKIYGYGSKTVTFDYNVFVPNDIWYGFDFCRSASSSSSSSITQASLRWFLVILGLLCVLF